ncbi:MAG: hypothetical protein ACYC27_20920 [Armatimonadota bacterium]
MAQFEPFDISPTPMNEQIMNWGEMIQSPYDKHNVDAYTRCRVILMNGIENNSVLTSHNIARMIGNEEINAQLSMIRRIDSQQQQTVNWLNPANQTIAETTIGYEQVAVDLTANLAQNEKNKYFKQVLDFALLEDFDHLFRYGCLMEVIEHTDPNTITQGQTEIKPGRPTVDEHRHPYDEMRTHFLADKVDAKTWMNYFTIVSGEQQTELFYKSHGLMYPDDMARKLYAEIAEIEEQHVSQYEMTGDPSGTPLMKMTLIQLNEAYNYYSCALTEPDDRIRGIWEQFCEMEIGHFLRCNELMKKFEKRDIRDLLDINSIEPLIVFESNKDYVNKILKSQVDLQADEGKFVKKQDLPSTWHSYAYQKTVNAGGVPSEQVVDRAKEMGMIPKAA